MKNKAILVVSFGTSYDETREKTIDVIEEKVAQYFGDYVVKRAFTSGVIINILKKRGITIPHVQDALEELVEMQIEEVYVLPTHLIPGEEYEKVLTQCEAYKNQFIKLVVADPLITYKQDFFKVAHAIATYYNVDSDKALVLMGHGSTHINNNVYPAMDYVFKDLGYNNVFVGTVEGYPEIDQVIKQVKQADYNSCVVAPFMLVAGDHAHNDMASDEEDSWKTLLENEGMAVTSKLIGMGEIEAIQEIYIQHLRQIAV